MSYILDALKKSEQDRGNGSIPSVQTIHSSSLNYHQEKRPLWPWILIIVLLVNISILIYFLKPDTNTAEINNAASIQQKQKVVEPVPVPARETMPATTPTIKPDLVQTTPDTEDYSRTSVAITATPQAPTQVVDIDELPTNIRRQIPDMVFSGHIYSTTARQRSLVINNNFMEEGDAVGQDLILVEITRNGAIFDFRDYRFSTSVLSGWSTH
ncbi:MAG: general secretion pathway protein GspB [Gammaproteobacteria bacterium]|nr:general secretion pathway protein GspB [Gammaproteobacteria bacterium]